MPKATGGHPKSSSKQLQASDVSAPALFSFLKQVSAEPFWDAHRVGEILNVAANGAADITATLEMLGYAEPVPNKKGSWRNTPAGDTVSGAKSPRFNAESVTEALSELRARADTMNSDPAFPFRITDLLAFGDFMGNHPKVQPADVGVGLSPKQRDLAAKGTAVENAREEDALRDLRAKSAMLQLHRLEDWMRKRSHRDLLERE